MAHRPASYTRADAERSFEQLYRGHRGDVYRASLRELGNVHDAEDVTQAAFVDAYRAVLGGTRPEAPRAWLLTIAENVRRRRFRTSLRRPREEPLDVEAAPAAEESNEQATALLDALAQLTAEQREAFLLREIMGLSYDEIAQRTGSTVSSVQMLLFRARKTLRDELEPPHVQGALFPLATLLSRFEPLGLTPRVAGAIGAAALAVSVGGGGPANALPPSAKPAARQLAVVAPATTLVTAMPARQMRAAKPAPGPKLARGRHGKVATPIAVAGTPSPAPVAAATASSSQPQQSQPQVEPSTQPTLVPQTTLLAKIVTPPAAPLPLPAVPTPSIPPPPLLDTVVEPVLEEVGAAGVAGANVPPLPLQPPVPLPPVLP